MPPFVRNGYTVSVPPRIGAETSNRRLGKLKIGRERALWGIFDSMGTGDMFESGDSRFFGACGRGEPCSPRNDQDDNFPAGDWAEVASLHRLGLEGREIIITWELPFFRFYLVRIQDD